MSETAVTTLTVAKQEEEKQKEKNGDGGCEDCNNASDPITLEEFKDLPPEFIFKVREKSVVHCFDIRALYEYYDKCGKLENPLNRSAFSEETLNEFLTRIIALGLTGGHGGHGSHDGHSDDRPPDRLARRQRRSRDNDDHDDDTVEIITEFRVAMNEGRSRHRRIGGRGGHGQINRRYNRTNPPARNVSVSSAILEAMGGAGNPIARAVINYGLNSDDGEFGASSSREQRLHREMESRQLPAQISAFRPSISRPPVRSKEEMNPRPVATVAQNPFTTNRDDYFAQLARHENILAASRPSGSSPSASFSASSSFSPLAQTDSAPPSRPPLAQQNRPVLEPFYPGNLPPIFNDFFPTTTISSTPTTQTMATRPATIQTPVYETPMSATPMSFPSTTPASLTSTSARPMSTTSTVSTTNGENTTLSQKARPRPGPGHSHQSGGEKVERKPTNWILIGLLLAAGVFFLALLWGR